MSSILNISNLCKSFGGLNAVDDVNFSLAAKTVTALIGPNGAGKSTCFNLLAGALKPDQGQVIFDELDVTNLPQHERIRAGIGRTFQIAATFGSMTVKENIQTALTVAGNTADELDELLSIINLTDAANSSITELSYGDTKAVELAMALAGNPKLLLLDEPTAGMAAASRTMILDRVVEIAESRQISILFTEHDMAAVFGYATRILVMDQGKLIADGRPDEIRNNALVQRVYLGEEEASDA